jgi:hypothetical protein
MGLAGLGRVHRSLLHGLLLHQIMKNWIITLTLVWLMAAPPVPAQQQPPPPSGRFTLLELCIVVPVLALATIAVICIRYREAHTPWPTNSNQWSNAAPIQPNPGTNQYGVFTNSFASCHTVFLLDGPAVYSTDLVGQGYCDTNATYRAQGTNTVNFTNYFQLTVKAGERPDNLVPLYMVRGWTSTGGRLLEYYDPDGRYLSSTYAFWGSFPQAPPIGTGLERARFISYTSP